MSKFNSRPVEIEGLVFDSSREGERVMQLKLMERAGEIRDLELDKRKLQYQLQPRFRDCTGKLHRAITYTPDARYFDLQAGRFVVEDVKAMDRRSGRAVTATQQFELRRKMFLFQHPDVEFRVVLM